MFYSFRLRERAVSALSILTIFILITQVALAGPPPLKGSKQHNLVLQKVALGKDFLIRASLIPQTQAATSHGTLSRVIQFKKIGNEVFLIESSDGQVVTNDLPSKLILARIPILKETAQTLVLDFNAGMQKVFVAGNWYASDHDGKTYDSNNRAAASQVSESFVDSIESVGETLAIRQIVQLNFEDTLFPTYEIRYFVSPYEPKKDFVARENIGFKNVGYFESAPQIETTTGRTTSNITRWDISKPVTYTISGNTPPEYLDAVREGILYWNKAFGREVLKVEVAPSGVTAPDVSRNIVQWVPWDRAGFAYADALSDPRNGEIKNAQVYFTSVFALSSKARARRLLRVLKDAQVASETKGKEKSFNAHLAFLKTQKLCDLDMTAHLTHQLEQIVNADVDDATILRLSQDMVRSVVAHEVGHTLGLRHNFSGKLATNVSLAERDRIFKEYLLHGKVPDSDKLLLTSSVMDYLIFQDDVLSGKQILGLKEAFPYDALAIRWGYSDKVGEPNSIDRKTAPLFSTDSHVGIFGDSERFTTGSKPMASNAWEMNNLIEGLGAHVMETYISAVSPQDKRDVVPLEEVILQPETYARSIVVLLKKQLSWMNSLNRAISIERRLPFVGTVNEEEVSEKKLQWIAEQVRELGGVDQVFFSLLPIKTEKPRTSISEMAMKSLKDLLSESRNRTFVGLDGMRYSFSDQDVALIEKRAEVFFKKLELKIIESALDILATSKIDLESGAGGPLSPESMSVQIEKRLLEVADHVLFSENGNLITGKLLMSREHQPTIAVRAPKYSFDLRQKAAALLKSEIGTGLDWSLEGRRVLTQKLKERIELSLGKLSEITPSKLERPLRHWHLEQTRLLKMIVGAGGCEDLLVDRRPAEGAAVPKKSSSK